MSVTHGDSVDPECGRSLALPSLAEEKVRRQQTLTPCPRMGQIAFCLGHAVMPVTLAKLKGWFADDHYLLILGPLVEVHSVLDGVRDCIPHL